MYRNKSLNDFAETSRIELINTVNNLDEDKLFEAFDLIKKAKAAGGRLHFTGIGKPSYVARYSASLFSSTGMIAYFLDGTETIHGSSGQVAEGDVVIAISNSGETEELKKSVTTLQRNGAVIIGVTGAAGSWLARNSDCVLLALSVLLQEDYGLDLNKYKRWHPGGSIGASIKE